MDLTKTLLTMDVDCKKKKHKGKSLNANVTKQDIKFLRKINDDPDKIEDAKKEKAFEIVEKILPALNQEIIKLYKRKDSIFDGYNDLKFILEGEKFCKAFTSLTKEYYEDEPEVFHPVYSVLYDIINESNEKIGIDSDILKKYIKTFQKVNKDRIKQITKKLGLEDDLEVAVTILLSSVIPNGCMNPVIVQKRLRTIYQLIEDVTPKSVQTLFKAMYGKQMQFVMILLLNEKKNKTNAEVYDVITEAICKTLNKKEKVDIISILKKTFKNGKKYHLECRLNENNTEDYSKLNKAYKRVASKFM